MESHTSVSDSDPLKVGVCYSYLLELGITRLSCSNPQNLMALPQNSKLETTILRTYLPYSTSSTSFNPIKVG